MTGRTDRLDMGGLRSMRARYWSTRHRRSQAVAGVLTTPAGFGADLAMGHVVAMARALVAAALAGLRAGGQQGPG